MLTIRPGAFSERPTRLLAWMYSDVVFGWPTTYIYDRRGKQVGEHVGAVSAAVLTRELEPLLAQK